YLLNAKRMTLNGLEVKYGLSITLVADDHVGPSHFAIERGEARLSEYRDQQPAAGHVRVDTAAMDAADAAEPDEDEIEEEDAEERPARADDGERGGRKRRRRGRGRGEERPARQAEAAADAPEAEETEDDDGAESPRQAVNGA